MCRQMLTSRSNCQRGSSLGRSAHSLLKNSPSGRSQSLLNAAAASISSRCCSLQIPHAVSSGQPPRRAPYVPRPNR